MFRPKLKYLHSISAALLAMFLVSACADDAEEPKWDPEPEESSYVIPQYPDDYRAYASWGMRYYWGSYNLHDPSMEKDGNMYYVFSTNASYGNEHVDKATGRSRGLYMSRRSSDLINWEYLGFAFPKNPDWVLDSLNDMRVREGREPIPDHNVENSAKPLTYSYWAPCARKVGSKFRLYYSIFVDDIPINYPDAQRNSNGDWDCWTERAFVGWAEADRLEGPWEDKGMVAVSVTDGNATADRPMNSWNGYWAFNGIDPTFIIDQKTQKHWLIFGSWHSGIAAIELDPVTGQTLKDPNDFNSYTKIAQRNRNSRWQGLEAPEVVYNEKTGFYYLFLAYDELHFNYNTRVARSATIDGTYYGSNERNVTNGWEAYPIITHPYKFEGDHGWQGISHCAVYYDEATDKWFYSSQARPSGEENRTYCMVQHIHEIVWTEGEDDAQYDGWPIVVPERYAGVPTTEITDSEIEGEWDVILMKYERGNHNVSQKYVFKSDKKFSVAGSDAGTWSFDAEKKVLKLGWDSGITDRLYVQDALNWEASPRVTTITFTGLTSEGAQEEFKTAKVHQRWGRKVK